MIDIGLDLPKSKIVNNFAQSLKVISQIGLPAIIRPAFTLGGLGGGIARTKKEFLKLKLHSESDTKIFFLFEEQF